MFGFIPLRHNLDMNPTQINQVITTYKRMSHVKQYPLSSGSHVLPKIPVLIRDYLQIIKHDLFSIINSNQRA